jgi:hypothetical protein
MKGLCAFRNKLVLLYTHPLCVESWHAEKNSNSMHVCCLVKFKANLMSYEYHLLQLLLTCTEQNEPNFQISGASVSLNDVKGSYVNILIFLYPNSNKKIS